MDDKEFIKKIIELQSKWKTDAIFCAHEVRLSKLRCAKQLMELIEERLKEE